MAASTQKIDRQITTPFLLKLFYREGTFHRLDEFTPGASASQLPPHLQIYTWQSCSLRELTQLVTSALPSLLPSPAVGTRVAFRLVFPDTRGSVISPHAPGRFLTKELGSVVVDASSSLNGSGSGAGGLRFEDAGGEPDRTLQDAKFVIGDYVSCAVLPPLPNGGVAPPPAALPPPSGGRGGYAGGGGGAPPPLPRGAYMDAASDGYRGRGGRNGFGGSGSVPFGEWRRGERIPDEPRYGGGGGRGRGRRR